MAYSEKNRDALKEYTRERVPLDWAMSQNNLVTALQKLGERERNLIEALSHAMERYDRQIKELAAKYDHTKLLPQ